MGKLGMAGLLIAATVACATEAAAQDFGQRWADRITHELEQERGPLTAKPVAWSAAAGLLYTYDNNIFLTQDDKENDSIVTPFLQGRVTYTEQRFELEADALVNYKYYFDTDDARDDEERVFLRARQVGARWNFEISEIFQNVSDPSSVVFAQRASRVISTTIPKIGFDITKVIAIELQGSFQVVRFEEGAFTPAENNNYRFDATFVYRTPWAFDALVQFGYYDIQYTANQSRGAPPDAFGYYPRIGIRGQLADKLSCEAMIGYTSAESDFFESTGNDVTDSDLSAVVNLRYEVSERITAYLDYQRMFTFLGYGDPYQLVDEIAALGEFQLSEQFTLRLRLQWDMAHSALDLDRSYGVFSLGGDYKFSPHLIANAGATYRTGKSDAPTGDSRFSDFILSVGFAYAW